MFMLKQAYKIDELGYLKEIYVKDFDEQGNCTEELEDNIITVDPPQGLYQAKWTETEWVETLTTEEITALQAKPEPTVDEQLMLAVAELDAQRIKDKLETQLAIAELTNTIIGGTVNG